MAHTRTKKHKAIDPRLRVLAIATLCALVILGLEAYRLAAGPRGEKQCPPLIPVIDDEHTATLDALGQSLPWEQRGGLINDASCLDATPVFGIVDVQSETDIKNAITFAKEQHLKVSIAGVRHSMGGQAFAKDAVVLDMRHFNQMSVDADTKILTVQSGAIWKDIQTYLHPRFAVKSMQSTDLFTVGGSISVNAHGMDHQAGSVGDTVESMRFMLPSGEIRTLSRTENAGLFNLVVGGYGLFGVILDVELHVVDNDIYQSKREYITYDQFPGVFEQEIAPNKDIGLFYGHLSTARSSLLSEMILYTYTKAEVTPESIPPIPDYSATALRRFMVNFSKLGTIPMEIKWWTEKYVEPRIETCDIKPRAGAMGDGERCLVSRNEPMHDSVAYLRNQLPNETDILQEYYIPHEHFVAFIDDLREIILREDANLLNASIRVVHKANNVLSYSNEERFAVVLYFNQKTDDAGNAQMATLTRDIIDAAIKNHGTFFLPYQLYYTPEQLRAAYPMVDDFFAAKKRIDPGALFETTFYQKYGGG